MIVLTGISAAGKSTVGELLASQSSRGVHVRGDVFRRMVVGGRVEMTPDASEEALAQLTLRYELTALTADRYAEAGFDVVVQDVVLGDQLLPHLQRFQTRPLHLVVLDPRPDVVAARESARPKKAYRGDWTPASMYESFQRDTPRVGLWLDTSNQTPAETATEILARLDAALVLS